MSKHIKGYNPLLYKTDETVATEFIEIPKAASGYVSEYALESNLISKLKKMGYKVVSFTTVTELKDNLREKIEELNIHKKEGLNKVPFSDNEWERFYSMHIANPSLHILEKTKIIQESPVIDFIRDDGTNINIMLFDKNDPLENKLQVMHQYSGNNLETGARKDNRYDVTILVNGLPLVHIELKRPTGSLEEAYNEIDRYQKDSFWAGDGLFEFIQIFVISNGISTRYYANTLRQKKIGDAVLKKKQDSFSETSMWSDGKNTIIDNLEDFAETFLAPSNIRKILARYCVLNVENKLLVLRPYQIYATEQILHMVDYINKNHKWGYRKTYTDGSIERPGGFIWHATGSGKTLTSFKTSQMLADNDYVDAVMFVVDRRDLSYQSECEFNKFKKDSVNGTKDTTALYRQLKECSDRTADKKVVVTTIQKLSYLVKKYDKLGIYDKNVVIIFDECHRSQFGDMHDAIIKKFKKAAFFGFTGTPIMPANALTKEGVVQTTHNLFGECLHTYLTIDAINNGNVLPWKFEIYKTFLADIKKDEDILAIDKDKIFLNKERLEKICRKILSEFNAVTYRGQANGNMCGMLAVESIEEARLCYIILKELQKESKEKLHIATIFTANANEEVKELEEDTVSIDGLDKTSIDFLNDIALKDYNEIFGTSFTTSTFYNYYKDLSRRVRGTDSNGFRLKLEETVDLVIVVNMLTTGFDAPRLNTIWLDKFVKYQGLYQLISRANRLYGPLKRFGNIFSFRDIKKDLDDAINLFCNKDATSIVLLKTYEEYLKGYIDYDKEGNPVHVPGFLEITNKIRTQFPYKTDKEFASATLGSEKEKEFVKLFNQYLKLQHILSSFDDYILEKETLVKENKILNQGEFDKYKSKYNDLYEKITKRLKVDPTDVTADIVFELELIKKFDVDVDYILNLLKELNNGDIVEMKAKILSLVDTSLTLRPKRKLIEEFIDRVYGKSEDIDKEWKEYVESEFIKETSNIITEHNLKEDETFAFVKDILSDSVFNVLESQIAKLQNKKQGIFAKGKKGFKKDKDSKFDKSIEAIRASLEKIYNNFNGLL